MSEFKVGDKVRIVSARWDFEGSNWRVGTEGVLLGPSHKSSLYPFWVTTLEGQHSMAILPDEIELVESAPVEEDYAVEDEVADEYDVAAVLRLMGVDVSDEEMETAVELAIMLGSAREAKEADNG